MSQIELGATSTETTTVELASNELDPKNAEYFEVLDQKLTSLSCAERLEFLERHLEDAQTIVDNYYRSEEELIFSESLPDDALSNSLLYLRNGRRVAEERALGLLHRRGEIQARIERRRERLAQAALSSFDV